MVNLADAIATLRPTAVPLADYEVRDDGAGPVLASWDTAKLGPPPTPQQIAAVTQPQVDAARGTVRQTAAVADLNRPADPLTMKLWGVVLVLLDEVNALRARVRAGETAVRNAATFAAHKTAVTALPALPDRTEQQAKAAVRDRITNNQTGS